MVLADHIAESVFRKYIRPALDRGDKSVTLKVSEVCFELDLPENLDLVCGVLGSMRFRNTFHLALESIEHPQGGPGATKYRFRLDHAKEDALQH
jgi:hypothetical protein